MTKPPMGSPGSLPTLPKTKFSLKTSEQIPNISQLHPTLSECCSRSSTTSDGQKQHGKRKIPKNQFLPHFHLNLSLQSSCSRKMEKVTPTTHSKRHQTWKNMEKNLIWKSGMEFPNRFLDLVGFSENLGIQTWEFKFGIQEGFCGIQGLKAAPVGSNPLLIHIFAPHFSKRSRNPFQDPPTLPKNQVLIIMFPILSNPAANEHRKMFIFALTSLPDGNVLGFGSIWRTRSKYFSRKCLEK